MPSTIAWLSNHTNGSLLAQSLWEQGMAVEI
jgi:hypothetical protein